MRANVSLRHFSFQFHDEFENWIVIDFTRVGMIRFFDKKNAEWEIKDERFSLCFNIGKYNNFSKSKLSILFLTRVTTLAS